MPIKAKASDVFNELELAELQEGVRLREKALKAERARVEGMALDVAVQEVDDRLKVIKGDGPLRPGLKAWLGVSDKDADPAQMSLDDGFDDEDGPGDAEEFGAEDDDEGRAGVDQPDYATWELTVEGAEQLVNSIAASDFPAAAKILRLNRVEAGEKEKEPRPRDGVLRAIRSARSALTEKVQSLAAGDA